MKSAFNEEEEEESSQTRKRKKMQISIGKRTGHSKAGGFVFKIHRLGL